MLGYFDRVQERTSMGDRINRKIDKLNKPIEKIIPVNYEEDMIVTVQPLEKKIEVLDENNEVVKIKTVKKRLPGIAYLEKLENDEKQRRNKLSKKREKTDRLSSICSTILEEEGDKAPKKPRARINTKKLNDALARLGELYGA